jgi:hypothetical protein
VGPGEESYLFDTTGVEDAGYHVLAFRFDPEGAGSDSVVISDIGLVPEPVSMALIGLPGTMGLLIRRKRS